MAAAHAGCFTMALSLQLSQAGLTAESLETACTVTLEQKDGGFAITESHLELKAKVPGASVDAFQAAAQAAKAGAQDGNFHLLDLGMYGGLAGHVVFTFGWLGEASVSNSGENAFDLNPTYVCIGPN